MFKWIYWVCMLTRFPPWFMPNNLITLDPVPIINLLTACFPTFSPLLVFYLSLSCIYTGGLLAICADILHICLFKTVCFSRGKEQIWEENIQVWMMLVLGCWLGWVVAITWKEPADVRDFIIHSQLSSACSAVPGTAPPRQAGYVKELPGIGGV